MSTSLKIRYEWRILYDDGTLVPVPCFGPHYDKRSLASYATPEEAEQALVQFAEDFHSLTMYDNLILVKRYNVMQER